MPNFFFEATDEAGRIARGKLEAADKRAALDRLRAAGFHQIDLATDNLKDHERPPEKSVNVYGLVSAGAGLVALGLLPVFHLLQIGGAPGSLVLLGLFCVAFVSAFIGFFNRHSYRSLNWISLVMLLLCVITMFATLVRGILLMLQM